MSSDRVELDPNCELFRQGDPDGRTLSWLHRWSFPVGFGIIGITTMLSTNYIARRPVYSSIHRHVIAAIAGAALGEAVFRHKRKLTAEKDLQFYHYMTLHPEHFPPPRQVLFRDYIERWIPCR